MSNKREKELVELIQNTPENNPNWIKYVSELSKLNPHLPIKTKRGFW